METPPITFIRQAWDELKKVKWPTQSEIVRLTVSVIVISIIVGVFLGGVDFILTKGIDLIIK